MPTHCEPWPGNTNTVLPTDRARPATTPAPGSPPANSAKPRNKCSRSAPTTTARCSKTERAPPTTTPHRPHPDPRSAPTCASNRAAWPDQRLRGPGRQHPRHHRPPSPTAAPCARHPKRSLLHNHMRIGAADSERRHPRPTRPTLADRPCPRLRQQRHRPRRPIHMRARHIHMQRLRHHLMPHRLHHLDHPGHTRRRLRMAHVRFDRPQPQRPSTGRSCP